MIREKPGIRAGLILTCFCLCLLVSVPWTPARARDLERFESSDAVVLCDPRLAPEAREVARLCPVIRKQLRDTLLWDFTFRPVIMLVGERGVFQQMAGNRLFVAYAVPEKQVIVIDLTRMGEQPFTLEMTLKHELCHMLLHHSMGDARLPKWLDEGIAQWISEGIPELITFRRESLLTQAALTGSLYSLDSLSLAFPRDERGIALAYEESRSVVEYLVDRYGRSGILNLLGALKGGADMREAVKATLLTTYPALEQDWRKDLLGYRAILAYLAANLYTIIFILAALLCVWAYVRFLIRKKSLKDEPEDQEACPS